ncbi:hypothetical protein KUCAC02_029975, partial [Chaenocephalus aceratus]
LHHLAVSHLGSVLPGTSSSLSQPQGSKALRAFETELGVECSFETMSYFKIWAVARGKAAWCWLNLSKQHLYRLFLRPAHSSIPLAPTRSVDELCTPALPPNVNVTAITHTGSFGERERSAGSRFPGRRAQQETFLFLVGTSTEARGDTETLSPDS